MAPKKSKKKGKKKADRIKVCDRVECKVGVNYLKGVKHTCPSCQLMDYCSAECLKLDRESHDCVSVTKQLAETAAESERVRKKKENDPSSVDSAPSLTIREKLNIYKNAKEGNANCQYILGCNWARRADNKVYRISKTFGPELTNIYWSTVPVAESKIKAAKYFKMAAENGHRHAMESYAERLSKGDGVAYSFRNAADWYWKAYRIARSSFQINNCQSTSILCKDWQAIEDSIEAMSQSPKIPKYSSTNSGGPNISSLWLALASGPSKLLGMLDEDSPFSVALRSVQAALSLSTLDIHWTHGRKGTMTRATELAMSDSDRTVLSTVQYKAGRRVKLSDVPTNLEQTSPVDYRFVCCHFPKGGVQDCTECNLGGMSRVFSVNRGWYYLSEQAVVRGMFYQAIVWDGEKKIVVQENFKPICKEEVDETLRVMTRINPLYCNPWHIASMPNLFWPVVHYYGSIRDALSVVVPNTNWNRIFGVREEVRDDSFMHEVPSEDIKSMFSGASSDEFYYKCDNTACCKLGGSFSKCKCLRVRYCGRECQKEHRKNHRAYCLIK